MHQIHQMHEIHKMIDILICNGNGDRNSWTFPGQVYLTCLLSITLKK